MHSFFGSGTSSIVHAGRTLCTTQVRASESWYIYMKRIEPWHTYDYFFGEGRTLCTTQVRVNESRCIYINMTVPLHTHVYVLCIYLCIYGTYFICVVLSVCMYGTHVCTLTVCTVHICVYTWCVYVCMYGTYINMSHDGREFFVCMVHICVYHDRVCVCGWVCAYHIGILIVPSHTHIY